jgi:hypothetical protein
MQQTSTWLDHKGIEAALDRLGIPLIVLQEALQAGYLSRISRTTNDAPSAPGFYQWNDTLRTLRDSMVPSGWRCCDKNNLPTIIHPKGTHAIAISSGNRGTGDVMASPSTKNSKGLGTEEVITNNARQLNLFDFAAIPKYEKDREKYPTWLLLFYLSKKELRAELSLPVNIDSNGYVDKWRERIILPSLPLQPTTIIPKPDFGPDIDIQIPKKA